MLDPAFQLMLRKPAMQDSHIITQKFKMPAHHFAETGEVKDIERNGEGT